MLTVTTRRLIIGAFILLLLAIPLIAMQFSGEVHWTAMDFTMAAFLLVATGIGCEFVLTRVKTRKHRLLLCSLILAVLFVIWVQLAVGIIDLPLSGH